MGVPGGQVATMTQTPSSSHHHHHHQKEHHQQQQQQLSLLHQQRQHHLQLQQDQQSLARRNSALASTGVAPGVAANQHIHYDPLNAVALSGSGMIPDTQILQSSLPPTHTSTSIIGSNIYQQSMCTPKVVHGSTNRLSPVPKPPINHNITTNVQHSSSIRGKPLLRMHETKGLKLRINYYVQYLVYIYISRSVYNVLYISVCRHLDTLMLSF